MSALDVQVGGNHYRQGGIQPVQYIEANKLGYLEGVVVKRVTRHNQPGGKGREDIEKAIHELQLLLELRYPQVGLQVGNPRDTIQLQRGLRQACLVCGASDGHGGLQCPNSVMYCAGTVCVDIAQK